MPERQGLLDLARTYLEVQARLWPDLVGTAAGGRWFAATVHGVLAHYDLPDLVRAIGPGRVRWQDVAD
jgi:hypothetical protein